MFVKLRKKTILPIKYFITRKRAVAKMEVKGKKELSDRLELEQKELMKFKRLRRIAEENQTQGKINILKWILSIED